MDHDAVIVEDGVNKAFTSRFGWQVDELAELSFLGVVAPVDDYAAQLRRAMKALPATDRRVFDLMFIGERDTAVFAYALGLTERPPGEQFDAVKRAKDRIKARLKRAGGDP